MPFKHSQETRRKALKMIEEVGVNETARRTGIARGQLYQWRHPEKAALYSARASKHQNVGTCEKCGRPSRRDIPECRRCQIERVDEVNRRRALGQTSFTIALAVGMSIEQVRDAVRRRRKRARNDRVQTG